MTPRPAILALLVAGLGAGCLGKGADRREGRYHLGRPGPGWERVDPGAADRAWFNPELSATIYGDSNCGARFEDSPLPSLANHLTWGIATGDPLREETLTLDEREAYLRMIGGELDGVPVHLGVLVLKKNRCVYDVLYVAPPTTFERGWADFVAVVQGFEARG